MSGLGASHLASAHTSHRAASEAPPPPILPSTPPSTHTFSLLPYVADVTSSLSAELAKRWVCPDRPTLQVLKLCMSIGVLGIAYVCACVPARVCGGGVTRLTEPGGKCQWVFLFVCFFGLFISFLRNRQTPPAERLTSWQK